MMILIWLSKKAQSGIDFAIQRGLNSKAAHRQRRERATARYPLSERQMSESKACPE